MTDLREEWESLGATPAPASGEVGGEVEATARHLVSTLRQITRAIDLHSRALLHKFGLTSPQLATLQAIAGEQPISAGAIAKRLHLGQPTVTGILDRLERRGFIQRVRGERDRRSVMLTLTVDGERVLNRAPSLLQQGLHVQLARLRPWERAQILSSLLRVAELMDESARQHGSSPAPAALLPTADDEKLNYPSTDLMGKIPESA